MKVLALAADNGGCGFYRMYQPARVTKDLGIDITVDTKLPVSASTDNRTGITTVHEVHSDADVIIIQRPLNNAFTSMIAQAKRQGIATVVELDDDFENVHPRNLAHPHMNNGNVSHHKWVRAACEIADLVTVSTPALERYALHGRSAVLRNRVPAALSEFTPSYQSFDPDNIKIGWTGSVQTHPEDLQVTKGAVADVVSEHGLGFYNVGDGIDVQRFLRLKPETQFEATGWIDMELYYQKIADMTVGIVPLEISPFNEAKSALKGLEMAAMGVPFVASPTREYQRMEAYNIGQTARTPGEWRKKLDRLVTNPDRILQAAKEQRDLIFERHTYEATAYEWVAAWGKAIDNRKSSND